jgi:hypothetical protein
MDGHAPYLKLLRRQRSPSCLELSLFGVFARRLEEVQSEHVPVAGSVLEQKQIEMQTYLALMDFLYGYHPTSSSQVPDRAQEFEWVRKMSQLQRLHLEVLAWSEPTRYDIY